MRLEQSICERLVQFYMSKPYNEFASIRSSDLDQKSPVRSDGCN